MASQSNSGKADGSSASAAGAPSPFPPATRLRWRRALLGILLASITFILGASVLHHFLPRASVPVVTPKTQYFRAHKDDYDAIFIGSSRVVHGIAPEIFDATLAARGIACRSFNLGVERMFPPESLQMLQAALATKPARLKWVFIEMTPIYVSDVEPTLRSITWHDNFGTKLVAQELATRNGTRQLFTRWGDELIGNLKLWAMNAANVGRVPALIQPEPDEAKAATAHAGYMPLQGTHFENAAKEKKYHDALAAMMQPVPPLPEKQSVRAFFAALDQVHAAGAQLVIFVTPLPQTGVDFLSAPLAQRGANLPILQFNDAAKYAPFYQLDHRYDGTHLNDVGARAFSAVLAESFADAVQKPAR